MSKYKEGLEEKYGNLSKKELKQYRKVYREFKDNYPGLVTDQNLIKRYIEDEYIKDNYDIYERDEDGHKIRNYKGIAKRNQEAMQQIQDLQNLHQQHSDYQNYIRNNFGLLKASRFLKEGGNVSGPSHDNGGVPIEVEGGEYVIKKDSVNASTEPYLEYINQHGKLPLSNDARKRRK